MHRGRSERSGRRAALFAEDLLSLGGQVLARLGAGATALTVPITIPVDGAGVVVVSAAPPELADPEARRQPARLELERTGEGLIISLALDAGRPLRLPGVRLGPGGPGGEELAALRLIAFDVTGDGMTFTATGPDGEPSPVVIDEATACQLATALLLTFRVKLTKADRPEGR
ncbi:MAG: hypothetical protein ABIW46_09095 [Acidimicrobiales bacterium]